MNVTDPVITDTNATYTPGISEMRGGVSSFYHCDFMGSTVGITNANENVTDSRQYDAFGNLISSSGTNPTPFGSVGAMGYQSDPDSGLMLLGHRYYDPSTGRFLSQDPAQAGRNWYAYCDGNPTGFVDLGGLWKAYGGSGGASAGTFASYTGDGGIWGNGLCTSGAALLSMLSDAGASIPNSMGIFQLYRLCTGKSIVSGWDGGSYLNTPGFGVSKGAWTVAALAGGAAAGAAGANAAGGTPLITGDEIVELRGPYDVPIDANGFPNFSEWVEEDVGIEPTGNYPGDIRAANEVAGLEEKPTDYTWHHHQDYGRMQLVPTAVHQSVCHIGGMSLWPFINPGL